MRTKVVWGTLAVIGLLALSATAAQAGEGGKPSVLTSFFVCRGITGDDANLRVDVDSIEPNAGWGFNLSNVRLGNATLACAFARLFPANSTHKKCDPNLPPDPNCNEISPSPGTLATAGKQLKCYAVSVGRGSAGTPPPEYEVFDAFDTNAIVNGSSVQYVCGPARFLEQ